MTLDPFMTVEQWTEINALMKDTEALIPSDTPDAIKMVFEAMKMLTVCAQSQEKEIKRLKEKIKDLESK